MIALNPTQLEEIRSLLCKLQDTIQHQVLTARNADVGHSLAGVAEVTAADTIYKVDKVSEEAIIDWFSEAWPEKWPIEIVMEGLEDKPPLTFPSETAVQDTILKCIIDPIDGTRNLMYDKRSAWVLSGVAPQRFEKNTLADIVVSAMTELPTSKQWRADQISGVKGCGPEGLVCDAKNILTDEILPFKVCPSQADNLEHCFASITHFFPPAKTLLSTIDEALWDRLHQGRGDEFPMVFDDQYITTGGQLYEIMMGRDRLQVDIRPLAFKKLGIESSLAAHPYDICTALLLTEAGAILEGPQGEVLDVPLDTTTPVSFLCFANETIAGLVRPILQDLFKEYLSL